MEVTDKRKRFQRYRTLKTQGYPQVLDPVNQKPSEANSVQSRPTFKNNVVNQSSHTPRLPLVNSTSCSKVKKEKDAGSKKWTTKHSLSNELSRQKSTADVYSSGTRGLHTRNRILFPSKNRISYPIMSSVDKRFLASFGSHDSYSKLKRKDFFLSDSALAIRSIELKPRITKKEVKCKTPPKTSNESETKLSDPLFPSLSGSTKLDSLYAYSSPLFSLSDDGDSLAPFLDGISLSPPPPSELSFSSPSQSPLYFSPNYEFLD